MRAGFDLDGVVGKTSVPIWLLAGLLRNHVSHTDVSGHPNKEKETCEVIERFLHIFDLRMHPRELLHKDDEYIIITGRAERFRKITKEWLKSHGIHAPLFMCNVGVAADYPSLEDFFDAMAVRKSQYIKSECIDVFFEDSPAIVKRLRKLCPKVRIIQVGGRLM